MNPDTLFKVVQSHYDLSALWGGSKRWTFSETMGLFQTIVTLPSVLSAVCIAQN